MKTETMTVEMDGVDGPVIINASDFDPAKHKAPGKAGQGAAMAPPAAATPPTPQPAPSGPEIGQSDQATPKWDRAGLERAAKELGVKFNWRTSDEKLAARVEQALGH